MLHNSVSPDSTLAVQIFLAELGVAEINLSSKKLLISHRQILFLLPTMKTALK
jgi:hypothetical protein